MAIESLQWRRTKFAAHTLETISQWSRNVRKMSWACFCKFTM